MRPDGDVRVQKATDCSIDVKAGEDNDDAELHFALRKAAATAAEEIENFDQDYDANYDYLRDYKRF